MSRGWESKDVESQQALAEQRASEKEKTRLTAEQIAIKSQHESLMLDRTRLLRDLANARHPRHADMIRQALAHIEAKLSALEPRG